MIYTKRISLILMCLTIFLFTGCSKKDNVLTEENARTGQENQGGMRVNRNMKIGKVVSVLSERDIEILEAKMPERPQGENPPPQNSAPNNGEAPERRQRGGAPGENGGIPGGNGNFMRNAEFTDNKIIITIPDDILTIMSGRSDNQREIKITDLKPDDIISYSEENGKITSIRLMSAMEE